MSKDSHDKGKGLAIGAAIGAVAGVVTGILFAPKSGVQTREDIKDTAVKSKATLIADAKRAHADLLKAIDKAEAYAKDKSNTLSDAGKQIIADAIEVKKGLIAKISQMSDEGTVVTDSDVKKALKKVDDVQQALQKILK